MAEAPIRRFGFLPPRCLKVIAHRIFIRKPNLILNQYLLCAASFLYLYNRSDGAERQIIFRGQCHLYGTALKKIFPKGNSGDKIRRGTKNPLQKACWKDNKRPPLDGM